MADPQVSPEKLPVVEQTTDLEKIKKNMQEIKSSVKEVQDQIVVFDKEKKNLAKDVLDQKQKIIEAKKQEIELKKKETETLIAKIKTEIAERKKTTIDEKLSSLDDTISLELGTYEKELKDIHVSSDSFWDKTLNWVSNNPGKTALLTAGVGLAIWGIVSLFKKKKNKKEKSGDDENSEEEGTSSWKKAMLRGGGILGGVLIWKNRDTLKDKFSDFINWLTGTKEKPPVGPASGSYENLSEELKANYRTLSMDVDTYSEKNAISFSATASEDVDKKGSILFGLDKQTKNLADFGNNDTLDFMSSKTDRDFIDIGLDWLKLKGYEYVGPYLTSLASFADFLPSFATDPLTAITAWLKGGKDREKELSLYFREYVNALNYVSGKKEVLAQQFAKLEIMTKEHLTDTPTEEQEESIQNLLESDEWRAGKLDPFLRSHCLSDLPGLLKEYAIDIKDESDEIIAIREAVRSERDEVLGKNEAGETAFDRADAAFSDGGLDEASRKELTDVCDGLLDDAFGTTGKTGFFEAYTHLITEIFSGNEEMAKNFKDKTQIETLIQEIRANLVLYKEKLKNNTFTKQDLSDLKTKAETYFEKKEYYEVSLHSFDGGSDGLHFSWTKLMSAPFQAFLDIGKAFGYGKTNSWRERLGYGLGGFYVSGQTLYMVSHLKAGSLAGKVLNVAGKTCIRVGELPYSLSKRALRLYLGKTRLTGRGWSKYIEDAVGLSQLERQQLLKYAFMNGEISEARALRIASHNNVSLSNASERIATIDDLLKHYGLDAQQATLFKKYRMNKNIRNLMIESKRNLDGLGMNEKIQYAVKDRALGYKLTLRTDSFKELLKIDEFLLKATHQGKIALVNGFMQTTKSLKPEMVDQLLHTAKFDVLSTEASAKAGKALGKNIYKFTSVEEFKAFEEFFVRHYKEGIDNIFIENSLAKWEKIKALGGNTEKEAAYILDKGLTSSRADRLCKETKNLLGKTVESLKKLQKNPKFKPFWKGFSAKEKAAQEMIETLTPEATDALASTRWLDNVSGFGGLTKEGSAVLSEIAQAIKASPDLLKSLSTAKTEDAVKDVLKGIVSEEKLAKIDGKVISMLSKVKNVQKIESIVKYGAGLTQIKAISAVLKNPLTRSIGKVLGKIFVLADFAFVGFELYGGMKEVEEIKQYNSERAANKKSEVIYDAIWGGLSATAGACMFIPGVGWIAGGVMLGAIGIKELSDVYFDEINTFKQNYADYLKQDLPRIKQQLVYVNDWQTGLDSSFQDMWSHVTGNLAEDEKKKVSVTTSKDAVKAMVYFEELQNYPYAQMDLNSAEVRKDPNLEVVVKEQKNAHDKAVEARFAYITATYITGKSSMIPKDILEKEQGLSYVDAILKNSRSFMSMSQDTEYAGAKDIVAYRAYLEQKVKKEHAAEFTKLEDLYTKHPQFFFEMYAYAPHYKQLLDGTGLAIPEEQALVSSHLDIFLAYATYKTLGMSVSEYPSVSIKQNPDTGLVDMDAQQITRFLTTFGMESSVISSTEITSAAIPCMDMKAIGEKYSVSSVLGQNILYEIAKGTPNHPGLGYGGANTLAELKKFYSEDKKTSFGIYFDEGDQDWAVNEEYGSDNEFATDNDLNSPEAMKQMRKWLTDSRDSYVTNDVVSEGDGVNASIINTYISIIDANVSLREHPEKVRQELTSFIKTHAQNGLYVELPGELLIKGVKAGYTHVGECVYTWDGTKVLYKPLRAGATPGF